MAVSKRLRFEILRRDDNTCRYCGRKPPEVELTVDHVTPTALGGSDLPENLVAACKDCNAGKTSIGPDAPLVADVAQKALEWGFAIERWNAMQSDHREDREAYVEAFDQAWSGWGYGPDDARKEVPKPSNWEVTIWRFFEAGLPIEDMEDAVKIACGNARLQLDAIFRYFCGVAWKRVEKMHEGARAVLNETETHPVPADGGAGVDDASPSPEWQAGYVWTFDHFAYRDLPYQLLSAHIDGRRAYLDRMRWVA